MKKILILNGSPSGTQGNCQKLIRKINILLRRQNAKAEVCALASIKGNSRKILKQIQQSDGLIFVTGTYWDSWGSPLQRLLEEMTALEGSCAVLGKPCAVLVLEHSVGGKGVLSRLQGVLSTMGFLIPPMSGMVCSLVADLALKKTKSLQAEDFWSSTDLPTILENFRLSLELQIPWAAWPVDRKNFRKIWLK